MFYTGNFLSILLVIILLAGQGFVVYISFITMGFLGMFTLPLIIANHLFCIFLTYKFLEKEERAGYRYRRPFKLPWIMIRLILGAVIVCLVYTAGYREGVMPFTKTESEREAMQMKAEKYLEDKYSEKFIIHLNDVKYIFAVSGYEIKAAPSLHPNIQFHVRGNHEFTDDYLASSRSYELDQLLQLVVHQYYGQNGFISTVVNEGLQPVPVKHYADLRSGTKEVGYQALKFIVFADLTEDTLGEESERLRQFILDTKLLVKQGEGESVSLSVDYRPVSSLNKSMRDKIKDNFDSANSSMGYDNYRVEVEDIFEVGAETELNIIK